MKGYWAKIRSFRGVQANFFMIFVFGSALEVILSENIEFIHLVILGKLILSPHIREYYSRFLPVSYPGKQFLPGCPSIDYFAQLPGSRPG